MKQKRHLSVKRQLDNSHVIAYCKRFNLTVPEDRDIWSGDFVFDTMCQEIIPVRREDLADIRRRGVSLLKIGNLKQVIDLVRDKEQLARMKKACTYVRARKRKQLLEKVDRVEVKTEDLPF